jgi:hypothetical protein
MPTMLKRLPSLHPTAPMRAPRPSAIVPLHPPSPLPRHAAAAASKVEAQGGQTQLIAIDHVLIPPSIGAKSPSPKAADKKAAESSARGRAATAALIAAPLLAAAAMAL